MRSLADLREEDRGRFGGKAVGLGLLGRAGLPVPAGFVLSVEPGRSRLREDERQQVRRTRPGPAQPSSPGGIPR